jgi:hypothetical protein
MTTQLNNIAIACTNGLVLNRDLNAAISALGISFSGTVEFITDY